MSQATLGLFEGYGIEIEYALVDAVSLDVRPECDRVLHERTGTWAGDVDDGAIGWSNELVLHQVELKTNGPVADLGKAARDFQASVLRMDALAERVGARLMPTGMHPWMVPSKQTRLWPHECHEVYAHYDATFDCKRHGWANVQATHLNLPFASDAELGRLLAATRLVLPLIPGLAASSPFREGRAHGVLDLRLQACRTNSTRVPSMAGNVIPEPVYETAAYHRQILEPLYADLRPIDPDGILQHEFANARGAIVRFDRNAIEVRLLDVQEHPAADLALAFAVARAIQALCEERFAPTGEQQGFPSGPLARLLVQAEVTGPHTRIDDANFLSAFGRDGHARSVGALWRELCEELVFPTIPANLAAPLANVLEHGVLSDRLLAAVGPTPTRSDLHALYTRVADCLRAGQSFLP